MILRKTILDLQSMKGKNEQIVALTAYDFQLASILDSICDLVLVGDSLGNVFQGSDTTLGVTLDDVVYHGKAVSRAISNAHLCIDMPFMTYQSSISDAMTNVGKVIRETGAQSVKLEISFDTLDTIKKISNSGIPVIAHVGLCPQSFNIYGGYKKQGKNKSEAEYIYSLAKEAVKFGASILVIEGVPGNLASRITKSINIPTIGIGAGNQCDGQILVSDDIFGLTPNHKPKFVRQYLDLRQLLSQATRQFISDCNNGNFPNQNETYFPTEFGRLEEVIKH